MAFRSGNNRRNFGGGGGNYGNSGGGMGGRSMNPWDNQSASGGNFGNMRQGGGGGGGGQGMSAEALTLANNLLNNLLRSQNPPSLLDLPRGGGGGGGMGGNRGSAGRQVGNRPGNRNRRMQGGFARGGPKIGANKPGGGGGIRKQNAFDRAKKLLAKNSSNKKKDSAPGDKTEKKKNESPKESIYADVPNDMFYCHLCKKDMWDANSFENHIKGRTHLMMREGIEESYRLKANMIRQEAKIAEQLKLIELDRLKRMGKSKNHNREYCTMCDLHFHGHLSAHRKSEGHLTLKKFLHPKCLECNKEFPTRIEFDTHLLTPEHLTKAAERNTKVGERKKNTLTILTEEDELKDVKQPIKKKKKSEPKKEGEGAEGEEGADGEAKKENGEAGEEEEKKEGEEGGEEDKEDDDANLVIEDPEDCILDFNDGDEIPVEIEARIPKYNWQRPVGVSLISKLECFECSLCGRYFDNEKTAEIHSRTAYHHRQFARFINDMSNDTKMAQKRAAAAIEENERKKRKLEADAAEESEATAKAENGGEGGDEKVDDLYDPSEATADDEDVEMNENPEEDQENAEEKKDESLDESANGIKDAEMKEEDVKEEEVKPEADQKTAEPPVTPKAASPPKGAQKTTPASRGGAQAKATPRGRGRGRYNRY